MLYTDPSRRITARAAAEAGGERLPALYVCALFTHVRPGGAKLSAAQTGMSIWCLGRILLSDFCFAQRCPLCLAR